MNPSTAAYSEVALDGRSEIVVDEDALSPRFRAQMEATLAPLAVIVVVAVFVARIRRSAAREVPHAA